MPHRHLKTFRVGVSLLFFTSTALLFLDFRNLFPPSVVKVVLFPQFVPSLLKFMNTAAFGAAGCVAVVLLTVLFGRVYCSTICPLGTLQDVIGYVARKKQKQRGFGFFTPHNVLRYSILAATLVILMAGSGFLLNLLDPFSSFGRIFSNLLRPVLLALNNAAAVVLEPLGIQMIYRVQWAVIAPLSAGFAAVTLVIVGLLCLRRGRLYCNSICPVGALLGLISKISLFQISIDPDVCKGCKLCERVCKAGCIDIRAQKIDFSRCVGCCNCFAVCPIHDGGGAVRFKMRWQKTASAAGPDPGRRGFIFDSVVWLAGITGVAGQEEKSIPNKPTTIPVPATTPVSPPGSKSIEHFTSTCTACHLCVSACPSRVLVPSLFEFGVLGMMQPRMNFHTGHCNYECTLCMDICPSGAILPLTVEKKKVTQLGVAKFIKENCVVYTNNTNCGACSEHCPTKAVDMVPYPNPVGKRLVIPKVTPDYCIGCGGCEHACPTKPYKAIYVDGNPVHKLAQKPVVKKINETVDYNEDFPF